MAILVGGPLVSGVLRRPPAPLPVLDQVPPTGKGRLVVFADPACPECVAATAEAAHSLARHLRSIRQGFDLEWIALGHGPVPVARLGPGVLVDDPERAAALVSLLGRRPEQLELRRGARGVLIDARGRVRALPVLGEPPGQVLLPAITQVVNGR